MTKLVGTLPDGDGNGLHVIARALVNETDATHVVVAVLKTAKITEDVEKGGYKEATARVLRIEVVDPDDLKLAERLLRRALFRRRGSDVLPLEMEDEISDLFKHVWLNPETGELVDEEPTDDEPEEDEQT